MSERGRRRPRAAALAVLAMVLAAGRAVLWRVWKNGAAAAGRELGVKVTYVANGDPGAQAKLIDNAVAQGKTGLVVSMANPDALKDSIEAAVRAGIPGITIHSGADT